MQICNKFDVIVVPFPYTDKSISKNRPALIISNRTFNNQSGHSVICMITSEGKDPWPLDVFIQNYGECGLSQPSLIRMKFFTLDNSLIYKKIGQLGVRDARAFQKSFDQLF
jgi:mRNA interferase MazF